MTNYLTRDEAIAAAGDGGFILYSNCGSDPHRVTINPDGTTMLAFRNSWGDWTTPREATCYVNDRLWTVFTPKRMFTRDVAIARAGIGGEVAYHRNGDPFSSVLCRVVQNVNHYRDDRFLLSRANSTDGRSWEPPCSPSHIAPSTGAHWTVEARRDLSTLAALAAFAGEGAMLAHPHWGEYMVCTPASDGAARIRPNYAGASTMNAENHTVQAGWYYRYSAELVSMYLRYCNECGSSINTLSEGYNLCEVCEDYRCMDCGQCEDMDYESTSDDTGRVHDWNYRPSSFRPKGNYPAEPLMGLELEVGGRARDIAAAVHNVDDCENHLYMKEDGSITGVEIVTHPMTLEYARTFGFDTLLRDLESNGSYVDDGYGLHIHVSRNAFREAGRRSATHQMSWLMFMYRNARQLQGIARREESRWARFRSPRSGELKGKALNDPSESRGDRYVAVNCNNERTFELRFFASTLDTTEFFAALELADASVEYTRTMKTADILRGKALSWDHFTTWVEARNYPNLYAEMVRIAE